MKKLLFACILIIAVSCKKDEPKPVLTVPHENIDLDVGDSYQIIASGGESFVYQSDEDFVATVSNAGIIKANKVGRAHIEVTSTAGTVTIYVRVLPKYTFFTEPLVNWNLTKSDILTQLGAPSLISDNGFFYEDSRPGMMGYLYVFNETSNKLSSSGAMMDVDYMLLMMSFLEERYQFAAVDDGLYIFLNHSSRSNVTMSVAIKNESNYLLVVYVPFTLSKSNNLSDLTGILRDKIQHLPVRLINH